MTSLTSQHPAAASMFMALHNLICLGNPPSWYETCIECMAGAEEGTLPCILCASKATSYGSTQLQLTKPGPKATLLFIHQQPQG